jgi:uncharacterized membrane protein
MSVLSLPLQFNNFISKTRPLLVQLGHSIRDKNNLALVGILISGALLRTVNLTHLFNVMHDYDEGAYALGGRLISQGQLPYSDYLLVHPPLYNLVLSWIYDIFGYDFFYGRYLSVVLSLICIWLIYRIGKKLYHTRAGLLAAALFAIEPMMVYLGRREVQEPLGLLLILIAIYCATDFIKLGNTKSLLWTGIALGLAISTKYVFLAAVTGIGIGIAVLILGENYWKALRSLGNPMLWLLYFSFAALLYCPLILLRYGLHTAVPVPFLAPITDMSVQTILVLLLIFVMPFPASIMTLKMNLVPPGWKTSLKLLLRNRAIWFTVASIIIGFILVTGYFLITTPSDFVNQTISLQINRPTQEFPSMVAIINSIANNPGFLKLISLPLLLIFPLVLLLLNRKNTYRSDIFMVTALVSGFFICQLFTAMPRYYVAVYPLLFIGLGSLLPPAFSFNLSAHKIRFCLCIALMAIFLSLGISMLTNYTSYDTLYPNPVYASQEESMYRETVAYLEEAGASKIFASNPTFAALSKNLNTFADFDLFAMIFLEERSPQQIVDDLKSSGVQYVILDPATKYWGVKPEIAEFSKLIRQSSRLVKVIEPSASCRAEIYLLGEASSNIFNGDFSQWSTQNEIWIPIGWNVFRAKGQGDQATIIQADISGIDCVKLEVVENGLDDGTNEYTVSSIYQQTPFPPRQVVFKVLPELNTYPGVSTQYTQGIHFVDTAGRVLIIGFSDKFSEDRVFTSESGISHLIIKPVALGQWSEFNIDLKQYWSDAGWPVPQNITIYVVLSTNYASPGEYAFYIAGIQTQ